MDNPPLDHCSNDHRCIVEVAANNIDLHRRRRPRCNSFGHLLFGEHTVVRILGSKERQSGYFEPKLSVVV